jgi:3-deoxy-D-manno-octulosonic-acid transferase
MLWRSIYNVASRIALPFALAYFYWRGRADPEYRRHWRERLGRGAGLPTAPIWIHAASVGEVVLITPLITALLDACPERTFLLTTFTPTGRAEAGRRLGDRVALVYLPLDTPGATRRFIRRVKPAAGIFVETELWPNLIAAAARAGVPMALVNASLSARSAATYGRWPVAPAARFMLTHIAVIAAAEKIHAQRFMALGAPAERVRITGNLKYDRATNPRASEQAAELRAHWQAGQRPVLLATSTHASEEAELLQVFARLHAQFPDLLWVVAPRHPQRFDAVAELLSASGWRWAQRSSDDPVTPQTHIVLADTLGELDMFYALADVAFVGGSLAPGIGGHNVIEPASAARVFVTGPHIEEWREPLQALTAAGGAVVAADTEAVAEALLHWLENPEQRVRAGQAVAAVAAGHRGALQRTLDALNGIIPDCSVVGVLKEAE